MTLSTKFVILTTILFLSLHPVGMEIIRTSRKHPDERNISLNLGTQFYYVLVKVNL